VDNYVSKINMLLYMLKAWVKMRQLLSYFYAFFEYRMRLVRLLNMREMAEKGHAAPDKVRPS
jgi:hypothetical protein